jgi:hypothetical protein
MTSRHSRLNVALFAGAIAFVVSCGGASGPSVSGPAVIPSAAATALTVTARCFGPFRPGSYYSLACVAEVSDTPSRTYAVKADLRIFGGPAEFRFPQCPACGGPPWTFDIDLHIPADMTPGVRSFPVWVTDAEGRRAETTAAVDIVAR